jgi:hypothetical protein
VLHWSTRYTPSSHVHLLVDAPKCQPPAVSPPTLGLPRSMPPRPSSTVHGLSTQTHLTFSIAVDRLSAPHLHITRQKTCCTTPHLYPWLVLNTKPKLCSSHENHSSHMGKPAGVPWTRGGQGSNGLRSQQHLAYSVFCDYWLRHVMCSSRSCVLLHHRSRRWVGWCDRLKNEFGRWW